MPARPSVANPEREMTPVRIPGPWRRLFARSLDIGLWLGALELCGLTNAAEKHLALAAGLVAGMFIYEWAMLIWCGSTIGKAVFGLRVVQFSDGEPLSGARSAKRTALTVLLSGLPFGSLVLAMSMSGDPLGVNRSWPDRRAGTVVIRRG